MASKRIASNKKKLAPFAPKKPVPRRGQKRDRQESNPHTISSQILTQMKGPKSVVAGTGGFATVMPDGTPWVGPIGEINSADHGLEGRPKPVRRGKKRAPSPRKTRNPPR